MKPYIGAVRQFGRCLLAALRYNDRAFAFEASKLTDLPLGFTFDELDDLQQELVLVANEADELIRAPLQETMMKNSGQYEARLRETKMKLDQHINNLVLELNGKEISLKDARDAHASVSIKLDATTADLRESQAQRAELLCDLDRRQYAIESLQAEVTRWQKTKADDEVGFARLGDLIGRLNVQIADLKKEVVELPELNRQREGLKAALQMTQHNANEYAQMYKEERDRRTAVEDECRRLACHVNQQKEQNQRLQDIVKWQTKLGLGMGGVFVTTFIERCFGLAAYFFG